MFCMGYELASGSDSWGLASCPVTLHSCIPHTRVKMNSLLSFVSSYFYSLPHLIKCVCLTEVFSFFPRPMLCIFISQSFRKFETIRLLIVKLLTIFSWLYNLKPFIWSILRVHSKNVKLSNALHCYQNLNCMHIFPNLNFLQYFLFPHIRQCVCSLAHKLILFGHG